MKKKKKKEEEEEEEGTKKNNMQHHDGLNDDAKMKRGTCCRHKSEDSNELKKGGNAYGPCPSQRPLILRGDGDDDDETRAKVISLFTTLPELLYKPGWVEGDIILQADLDCTSQHRQHEGEEAG